MILRIKKRICDVCDNEITDKKFIRVLGIFPIRTWDNVCLEHIEYRDAKVKHVCSNCINKIKDYCKENNNAED